MDNAEELFNSLNEVSAANKDVGASLRLAFDETWGGELFQVSGRLIDWTLIYETVLNDASELLNNSDGKLDNEDEFVAVLGDLGKPFMDYANMVRKYLIMHNINLYVKLGYLDLLFDAKTGTELYQVTESCRLGAPKAIVEAIERLAELYAEFSS